MAKQSKLVLEYIKTPGAPGQAVEEFRVMKIVDSIEYPPGALLPKTEVQQLCRNNGWSVTILPRSA